MGYLDRFRGQSSERGAAEALTESGILQGREYLPEKILPLEIGSCGSKLKGRMFGHPKHAALAVQRYESRGKSVEYGVELARFDRGIIVGYSTHTWR
jgi:hypothetical protein